MSLDAILIVNRSGGLIYTKLFNKDKNTSNVGSNELLILAGTLHSAFTLANCILPESLIDLSESYNGDVQDNHKHRDETYLPFDSEIKRFQYSFKYYPVGETRANVNINYSATQKQEMRKLLSDLTFKGTELFAVGNRQDNYKILDYHQVACIRHIETEFLDIYSHQSITGTKFICIFNKIQGDFNRRDVDRVSCFLLRIYALYSDIILKNPFYSLDMPIRNNEKFDVKVENLVELERFVNHDDIVRAQ